jgi:hypothetical protein
MVIKFRYFWQVAIEYKPTNSINDSCETGYGLFRAVPRSFNNNSLIT